MQNQEQVLQVKLLMKELNLNNISEYGFDLSEKEGMSYLDYIEYILSEEKRLRIIKRNERRLRTGNVPIKEYDPYVEGINRIALDRILTLEFVGRRSNIIIYGQCQTGKTSLASELARKVINQNANVYYINVCDLIRMLQNRDLTANKRKLDYMATSEMLIIDEFLYTALERDELTAIFRFLSTINEFVSIVLITNRYFDEWIDLSDDELLMQSLIERITSDCEVFKTQQLENVFIPPRKLGTRGKRTKKK